MTMTNRFATTLLILSCSTGIFAAQDNGMVVCPVVDSVFNDTRIDSNDSIKRFREISGLAFSPSKTAPSGEPILYGTNDGGGGERLGIWDSGTGDLLRTLVLPNTTFHNQDWESLSIGSCGSTGVDDTCIYIADVGDNGGRTSNGRSSTRIFNFNVTYRILKMPEPDDWDTYEDNEMLPESSLSVLPYNYFHPTSPTKYADCEGVFIDHKGWGEGGMIGDLYLITKWGPSSSVARQRVFKISASVWPTSYGTVAPEYSPPAVGSYGYGGDFIGNFWTRAESTFDGTVITIGNLTHNYLFLRCPGQSVAEVLAPRRNGAENCLIWNTASNGQVETIAWTPDGMKNLVIPEGGSRPMGYTTMSYSLDKTNQACPLLEWVDGKCQSIEDGTVFPDARCEASSVLNNIFASPTFPPPTPLPATPAPTTLSPTSQPATTASPTSAETRSDGASFSTSESTPSSAQRPMSISGIMLGLATCFSAFLAIAHF